ncbi:hypothetical protein GGF32_008868 [Allomyces javanicus]|nr:hypothetical protein GGF32_008868 [Allomyces javanicus]
MSDTSPAGPYQLPDPPTAAISRVAYAPTSSSDLLVASWDGHVRRYDTASNTLASTIRVGDSVSPVTNACWSPVHPSTTSYTVSLDRAVRSIDWPTQTCTLLGEHDAGLRALAATADSLVYTGGWDAHVRVWDARAANAMVSAHAQVGRVMDLDVTPDHASAQPLLVVATHDRGVAVFDRRQMTQPMQERVSPLKFPTRTVKCLPSGDGFVLASTEGRVAVEYFDADPATQARRFAFKCHRQTVDGIEYIYPVNAVAFHPKYPMTFATGGADGVVNYWDGMHKKRIKALPRQPTSIASLDFASDGNAIALAVSYTYEEGDKDHPPDALVIHPVRDADVRPRGATVRKAPDS